MTKDEMENKSRAFITEISEILGLGKPIDILKLCATTDLFFKPLEERITELEKENAELKEKLDKIRNYLVYDIFDRFKYLENLLKISQETQEELSKRILEQQKTIGSEIKNWIDRL